MAKAAPAKKAAAKAAPAKKTAAPKQTYVCASCGAVTTAKGHLCAPVPLEGKSACCDKCGKPIENARHICEAKKEDLKFVCDKCGRVATTRSLLCSPKKIPS